MPFPIIYDAPIKLLNSIILRDTKLKNLVQVSNFVPQSGRFVTQVNIISFLNEHVA